VNRIRRFIKLWTILTLAVVALAGSLLVSASTRTALAATGAGGGLSPVTTTIPSTATTGTSAAQPTTAGFCPPGEVKANDGICVSLPPGTSTLVFDDEFNSNSVNSSLWNLVDAHGDRSNNEPECFLPANVSESAGSLNELLQVENVTCPIDSNNGGTGTLSSDYASGAVQMSTFNFTYGTVQVRAKFGGGTGSWPAIWLLGANCQRPNWLTTPEFGSCNWPNSGSQEIDIAEILNSDHTSVNEQLHYGASNPDCRASTTDVSHNWHVYTLIWSANELLFQIDGVTTCKFTSPIPSTPMFMIINTAVGGAGGGPIINSTLPQTTQVDYVRVFQRHR
jgi:beta-glucanase (GH16 family)